MRLREWAKRSDADRVGESKSLPWAFTCGLLFRNTPSNTFATNNLIADVQHQQQNINSCWERWESVADQGYLQKMT